METTINVVLETMTINSALVLIKTLRQRQASLEELRNKVSTIDRWMTEKEKIVEPQYDVRKVDAKAVKLANAILILDSAIKGSNAVTNIRVSLSTEDLLSPIE